MIFHNPIHPVLSYHDGQIRPSSLNSWILLTQILAEEMARPFECEADELSYDVATRDIVRNGELQGWKVRNSALTDAPDPKISKLETRIGRTDFSIDMPAFTLGITPRCMNRWT